MRVLVAIVNYGTRNDQYLHRLLAAYRAMPWRVHVVVLTSLCKNLGTGVEVRVGVPPEGPRWMPILARRLFADQAHNHDLFVYTEDDTLLEARHIESFLRASQHTDDQTVPGFLRYEQCPDGCFVHTLHTWFAWRVDSIVSHGPYVFAEPTNLHSATYILTRRHLVRALSSGRFTDLHQRGRFYDLLEAATTHLYEHCGLRKVVPVSNIDQFLVHHLPNRYCASGLGIRQDLVRAQAERMVALARGARRPAKLLNTRTNLRKPWFDKAYWDPVRNDLLELVPRSASVLWVGCTGSVSEERLIRDGHAVTGIPLDSVVAASAGAVGVEVTSEPAFDLAFNELRWRKFDVVIAPEVLEYTPAPASVLTRLKPLVSPHGLILISTPNFDRWWFWPPEWRRLSDAMAGHDVQTFDALGLHLTTRSMVRQWCREAGLRAQIQSPVPPGYRRYDMMTMRLLRRRMANRLTTIARPRAGGPVDRFQARCSAKRKGKTDAI